MDRESNGYAIDGLFRWEREQAPSPELRPSSSPQTPTTSQVPNFSEFLESTAYLSDGSSSRLAFSARERRDDPARKIGNTKDLQAEELELEWLFDSTLEEVMREVIRATASAPPDELGLDRRVAAVMGPLAERYEAAVRGQNMLQAASYPMIRKVALDPVAHGASFVAALMRRRVIPCRLNGELKERQLQWYTRLLVENIHMRRPRGTEMEAYEWRSGYWARMNL